MHRKLSLGVLLIAAACSTAPKVQRLDDLKKGQRVVVGRVVVKGKDLSQWVPGIYLDSELVFDQKITTPTLNSNEVLFNPIGGHTVVDCGFTRNGCTFTVSYTDQKFYLLGFRVMSTVVVVHQYFAFPIWAEIPEAKSACDYIGTFVVTNDGKRVHTTMVDDFETLRADEKSLPQGCRLQKNIARLLNSQELLPLARKTRAEEKKTSATKSKNFGNSL